MDFLFVDHGSIVIMHPRSDAARDWTEQHIPEDAQRWGRGGVVIEPRYVGDIIDGITNDGLEVSFS